MSKASPIVIVEELAKMLASSRNLRILDGSWHLPFMNRNAIADYNKEHIPGALFFDITECCDPEQKAKGYGIMLPKPADFEAYVGKLGINNDTHVVVYDDNSSLPLFSAQRVWWAFRVFGHENVSVLEGGLRKWRSVTNQMSSSVPQVAEEKFTASYNPSLVKTFEDVVANLDQKTFTLLDARTPDHFEGRAKLGPGMKSGCIPGSLNMPFTGMLDMEKQTFKSKEELMKMFEALPVDVTSPIVGTCGSGIAGCMVALAAYLCGVENVPVYDGAWAEWYKRARDDQKANVASD
ncbi:hypothetical protein ACOMHN_002073 [Nucella lapillus]